jgi:hypothetical protein
MPFRSRMSFWHCSTAALLLLSAAESRLLLF